jgi:Flp pilus assembly protein TadB
VRRGAAAVAGIAAWLATGWVIAVIAVPLAILGWPWLMAPTRTDHTLTDRLDALAEWTRRVADMVELGAGLENAIISSRATCPAAIEPQVSDLVSCLQSGWSPADALYAFADRFGDATSDKIAAALILRAEDRGPGLARALKDFAATVRDEVRQRRSIAADRTGARVAVRWITYITLGMGGAMALNPSYAEPYSTPAGQIGLVVISAGFVGIMRWMRTVAADRPTPRFLAPDPRSAVTLPRPASTEAEGTR